MRKHSPLIWLAVFTIFFAILAWPLAVHAQGSAGGYGSSGGTFVSTYYSAGSSGGTYIARRTPTQVLPRLRARLQSPYRSVLRQSAVVVDQPVATPVTAAKCDCGCDCPGCTCNRQAVTAKKEE